MKPKVEIRDTKDAPNLQSLKDKFGIDESDTIVSYGNAIYAPGKTMSRDLMVHELVHCDRQGFNERSAERWWEKYMSDVDFRLQEELLAYGQQYKFCCKVYKDRNRQFKILNALAGELSSAQYGNIISQGEAMKKIRTFV